MTKTMKNLGFNVVNQNSGLLSSCSPPSFKFFFSVNFSTFLDFEKSALPSVLGFNTHHIQ